MWETFSTTISTMLVMTACIVLGFIAKKKKLAPDNTATVLSKLETSFIVPAMTINTFMNHCTLESVSEQYMSFIYCTIAMAISLVIAIPLSKKFSTDPYERNIYKYALTISNSGFLGNAIVLEVMGGNEALYSYLLYSLPLYVLIYTWGVVILVPQGEKKKSLLERCINPIFISVLIGAFLGLTGITKVLPSFIPVTLQNLSNCMGPIAMILTGFVIGDYKIKELLSNKKVYIVTVLRVFVLPALLIAVLYFLGADEENLKYTLFAFGSGLGLNTIVFPAAYGGDTHTGASMAMIASVMSIISIPLLYSLVTVIF